MTRSKTALDAVMFLIADTDAKVKRLRLDLAPRQGRPMSPQLRTNLERELRSLLRRHGELVRELDMLRQKEGQ